MRDDAVLGRALPLDRGLGPVSNPAHTTTVPTAPPRQANALVIFFLIVALYVNGM